MTALSRSVVYVLMGTAQFPAPIRIGRRAVRWVEQEVLDFIAKPPPGRLGMAYRVATPRARVCPCGRHAQSHPRHGTACAPAPFR